MTPEDISLNADDVIHYQTALFSLLQGLTEGHHGALQNFLRTQTVTASTSSGSSGESSGESGGDGGDNGAGVGAGAGAGAEAGASSGAQDGGGTGSGGGGGNVADGSGGDGQQASSGAGGARINMVEKTCSLLQVVHNRLVSEEVAEFAIQIMDSLIEFQQGPCLANQMMIVNSKVREHCGRCKWSNA